MTSLKRSLPPLILGVVLLGAAVAVAQVVPTAAKTDTVAAAIADITQQLSSPDAAIVAKGVDAMKKFIETEPLRGMSNLRNTWLKLLLDAKRYDDVEEYAVRLILASAGETGSVEPLLATRIRAFLNSGKADKALQCAKSLYNVSSMATTAANMLLVAECLNAAHPGDDSFTDRFRQEQMAGALYPPGSSVVPTSTPASLLRTPSKTVRSAVGAAATSRPSASKYVTEAHYDAAESVLAGIKVEGKEYQAALAKMFAEDYSSLMAKGNLLLLCDRAHDAQGVFERAYGVAVETQLIYATEAIARCMKAEDGCIGRANAWVLSIRPVKPLK